MTERIPVPRAVYDGLEAVRRSGLTNMLDQARVVELADELGFGEAADWVREDRGAVRPGGVCRDQAGRRVLAAAVESG